MESYRSFRYWSVVAVVGFAFFLDYYVNGLLVPLSPYSLSQKIGGSGVAKLYTAYSIGVFAATPLFAYFGDKFEYRKSMAVGAMLSATSIALLYFTTDLTGLLLGRFLQGVSASIIWTAGFSLIAACYPERRVAMMSYVLMSSTVGFLLGPVAGGWLFKKGGDALVLGGTGIMVAINLSLCLILLPKTKRKIAGTANVNILRLFGDRNIITAAFGVALAAIGWGIVEPLVPVMLTRSGVSVSVVGLIFTVGSLSYVIISPVVSWLSQYVSTRILMIGGTFTMALALPTLTMYETQVSTALGICVINICYAFILNPTSAELGNAADLSGMSCYAAVYAIYNFSYAIGNMVSSGFVSLASVRFTPFQLLMAVSSVMIAFIPLLLKGSVGMPKVMELGEE
ncbi:MAG: MFS transporter [Oligoflexales bacterium]|nr:MFS transporter [Oligoflexales bacterium]